MRFQTEFWRSSQNEDYSDRKWPYIVVCCGVKGHKRKKYDRNASYFASFLSTILWPYVDVYGRKDSRLLPYLTVSHHEKP